MIFNFCQQLISTVTILVAATSFISMASFSADASVIGKNDHGVIWMLPVNNSDELFRIQYLCYQKNSAKNVDAESAKYGVCAEYGPIKIGQLQEILKTEDIDPDDYRIAHQDLNFSEGAKKFGLIAALAGSSTGMALAVSSAFYGEVVDSGLINDVHPYALLLNYGRPPRADSHDPRSSAAVANLYVSRVKSLNDRLRATWIKDGLPLLEQGE